MTTGRGWLRVIAVALSLCAAAADEAAGQSTQEEIRQRIETLRESRSLHVDDRTIRPSELLAAVYESRAFVPLWSDSSRRAALRHALGLLEYDGLPPDDYHLAALAGAVQLPVPAAARAEIDLLHSDALLRAARDLRHGRVEPGAMRRRTDADLDREQLRRLMSLAALDPDSALALMRPQHFVYSGMTQALRRLTAQRTVGGWTPVPVMLMKTGTVDTAVASLRRRLAEEGDLPAAATAAADVFDDSLAAAVRSYQHRHGLNEDGVVGPATLRELQVPLEQRLQQLRVNLERARWIAHDLADTFVAVNVAGALVYYVRDGTVRFETRAIVGRTYTRTPIFSAQLRYIDVNPTWTVPPGIVQEILTAIRHSPGYLGSQRMHVIDRSGRVLAASSINFSRYTGATFPFVFRQDPGPLNPLGTLKFVFPNRYNVYLHDTPARELFARDERMFSHGCIRVQNPLALAELVLDDPVWTAETLRAAIADGRTRSIQMRAPIPVLVLYWTAATDLHGELHFYRDIYDRDGAVLRALR